MSGLRRFTRLAALVGMAALTAACAATLPPPSEGPPLGARAPSLATSVEVIARPHTNLGRLGAVKRRARELGLERYMRSEWIDWFSLQRNVLIEIPGSDPDAGVIYVSAHWDKTDVNPLKLVSLLVNGLLDELVGLTYWSQGAVDNATGVAIALELAASAASEPIPHTLRVLLPGAEESGLRGTRAHVSRMAPEERERVRFALNVDSVGTVWSPDCVSSGVSDPALIRAARAASRRVDGNLGTAELPGWATSDFAVFKAHGFWRDFGRGLLFNNPGGLLPQRSWFTAAFSVPVANFSACEMVDWSDMTSVLIVLPVGRIHGPRDRASQVDLRRLDAHYRVMRELLASPPEFER